jgi:hypothetical protein
MSKVDGVSWVVTALQAQLVQRRQGTASARTDAPPKPSHKRTSGQKASGERALERMAVHVSAIPADDPDRPRKLFRLFLQSLLVEQFGEQVLLDPAFFAMLDEVHAQMESNASIAARMKALVDTWIAAERQ